MKLSSSKPVSKIRKESAMKNREELEALKASWSKDPCWDIETTEGFEDHQAELMEFRKETEAKWEAARQHAKENKLHWLGNGDFLTLADFVHTPEEIETTLRSLDSQVGDCGSAVDYANFEITRAQVRASLLIAIQIKRVADAMEESHAYDQYVRGN
jgi:hypothetical protein